MHFNELQALRSAVLEGHLAGVRWTARCFAEKRGYDFNQSFRGKTLISEVRLLQHVASIPYSQLSSLRGILDRFSKDAGEQEDPFMTKKSKISRHWRRRALCLERSEFYSYRQEITIWCARSIGKSGCAWSICFRHQQI